MFSRKPLVRYGAMRRALDYLVALGAALLFSYLILRPRW